MTRLLDRLHARRERRERLREIAHVTPEEIAGLGLSRAEFTEIALLPAEQIARMEEMARIHGCDPARLDADQGTQVAVARTCARCDEQRRCRDAIAGGAFAEETGFCPNAPTYRRLAAV